MAPAVGNAMPPRMETTSSHMELLMVGQHNNRRYSKLALVPVVAEMVAIAAARTSGVDEAAVLCLQFVNVAIAIGILLVRLSGTTELSAAAFIQARLRFRIRTILIATAVLCGFLALARSREPKVGVLLLLWLSSIGLLSATLRDQITGVFALLAFHLFLGAFLLIGPIASYHINGRAWYDYGVSPWNPPVLIDENGKAWRGDYDPKYTPPVSWAVGGDLLYALCFCSIGIVMCPPVAPIVALTSGILLWNYRYRIDERQRNLFVAMWAAGLCPLLYLLVWGEKVLDWIAD